MRIAIAHYYWDYPEAEYGLPSALARRGNDVILSVWKGGLGETQTYRVNGFTVVMLPGIDLTSPLGFLKIKNPYVSGLAALYDDFSPEIIDCQSHLFFTTIESLREARRRGLPSVVTVRGVMAKRGFMVNFAQQGYLNTVAPRLFKEATIVRCLTQGDAREVERHGCPPAKTRVIPNFVDTEVFPACGHGDGSILWYGRFVEEKGLKHLVAAAREVLRDDRFAEFVLVGEGPQKEYLRRVVVEMGIQSSVSFRGKVGRKGLASLLEKASIFVIPSIKEGMPFSLLEAMSSAKAVIASDISGIRDVIQDGTNGILVPPGDAKALARAIARLRSDHQMAARLGEAARETLVKGYSEKVIAERIEGMYREAREIHG